MANRPLRVVVVALATLLSLGAASLSFAARASDEWHAEVRLVIDNHTPWDCAFYTTYPSGIANLAPQYAPAGGRAEWVSEARHWNKINGSRSGGQHFERKLTESSQSCVPVGDRLANVVVSVHNPAIGYPTCTAGGNGNSIWNHIGLDEGETLRHKFGYYQLPNGDVGISSLSCHRGDDTHVKNFFVTITAQNLANRLAIGYDRDLCVDAPAHHNGAKLIAWRCHDGANQRVTYIKRSWNQAQIQLNGKCLTVDPDQHQAGAHVTLWPCSKEAIPEQTWTFTRSGSLEPANGYRDTQIQIYGQCLDVQGGRHERNHLGVWPCGAADKDNQRFYPFPRQGGIVCPAATATSLADPRSPSAKPTCISKVRIASLNRGKATIKWARMEGARYHYRLVGVHQHWRRTNHPKATVPLSTRTTRTLKIRAVNTTDGRKGPIYRYVLPTR